MAYYAFLDDNNIVIDVIAGNDEEVDGGNWETRYSEIRGLPCKRTSYNTYGGKHLNGGTPFRKNYAGIGYTYDSGRDAFIPPKPYNSWVLDEETCQWVPPIAPPDEDQLWQWDENSLSWTSPSLEENVVPQ